jgi:hypothetical protein
MDPRCCTRYWRIDAGLTVEMLYWTSSRDRAGILCHSEPGRIDDTVADG